MQETPLLKRFDGIEAPRVQPDFFVIGAQKAGTTSLHHWLSGQPRMLLPRDKETHYLTHVERSRLGAQWYDKQFAMSSKRAWHGDPLDCLIGEVDPELLHHPRAAERMRALFGSPKIVIILRDPERRARSQHAMSVARGLETLGFEEALELETERLQGAGLDSLEVRHQAYWSRSCYGQAVARYQDLFGTENVLLLRFEALFQPRSSAERLESYTELLRFIGYTGEACLPEPERIYNAAWEPRLQVLSRFLHGERKGLRSLGRLIPGQSLRRWIGLCLDRMNRRQTEDRKTSLALLQGSELAPHWVSRFDREVQAVEALTGWDCNAWRSSQTQMMRLEGK